MYKIKKTMEIAGSHCLKLDYDSPCQKLHGHNWIITVYCKSEELNNAGMVIDFSDIKKVVNKLDHQHLNDVIDVNPTAENIAKWICDNVGETCYKVTVEESKGNIASYERNF